MNEIVITRIKCIPIVYIIEFIIDLKIPPLLSVLCFLTVSVIVTYCDHNEVIQFAQPFNGGITNTHFLCASTDYLALGYSQ